MNAAGGGVASVTVYQGGWTYSDGTGPLEAAGSDAGFHDAAASMFNLAGASNAATAQAYSAATVLQVIKNILQMLANYALDLFRAWSTPTTCFGPKFRELSGQSCDGHSIPCKGGVLKDLCERIGDIPNVSQAFKKCMKGRCACGGPYHPRLRVECDLDGSCNICGSGARGCSLGGTTMWYCDNTSDRCQCAKDVFHEMAHACGERDIPPPPTSCPPPTGSPQGACRIGKWFEDECESLP